MRYFNFTNNSLTKSHLLKGLWMMLTFQSNKNRLKSIQLISDFFSVDQSNIFLYGAARMGVYHLLKTMKLKDEDEVVVAGYTCVVLTNAIKFANLRIKYVDIDITTTNIDKNHLLKELNSNSKVLIIPHNFGIPVHFIQEIKVNFPDLYIIEDVAHSFGSTTNEGVLCGKIGHASFFSLEYSKPITSGLGGILVLNDSKYLSRLQEEYKSIGFFPKFLNFKIIVTLSALNLTFNQKYTFLSKNVFRILNKLKLVYNTSKIEIMGDLPPFYPVKLRKSLTNFLVIQLENITAINKQKIEQANIYHSFFSQFNDLIPVFKENYVLVRYPLIFKENIRLEQIQAIKNKGKELGFEFGEWFNDVVHPKGSFRYGYTANSCVNGEYISERILNIPINIHSPMQVDQLNLLSKIFKENGVH